MSCFVFLLNYAAPIFGFLGTVIVYFFGVPNKIDMGGAVLLACEEIDELDIEKIEKSRFIGNCGILLIGAGFLCQILAMILADITT